ncbi:MAG TPA: EAL domain-containing protein [Chthoniobacteraceae bacterium]|nr:EAL domain-containing protein [Chthoniobacteraceae bacterium]
MPSPSDPPLSVSLETKGPPGSILVVDDENELRRLLVRILETEGFAVTQTGNALEALGILKKSLAASPDQASTGFDLALLDVALPDMNGMTLFAKMQQDERLRQIPVIFLTGDSEYQQKARAFEAGAVDYITKPFQRKDLILRIRAHIRDKRLRDDEKQAAAGLATQARMSLSEAEQRFSALVRNSFHLVCELDENLKVIYASSNHLEILSLSENDLIGHSWPAFIHPNERLEVISGLTEIFASCSERRLLTQFRDGSSHWRWLDVCGSILTTAAGKTHLLLVSRDITHSKETERYLQHLALHDSLTGLANREKLTNRLEELFSPDGAPYAVMYLDLDNFKLINDRYGHLIGDQVLRAMGQSFKQAFTEAEIIARLGGDEFCVLFKAENEDDAADAAEKIAHHVSRTPIYAAGKRHRTTLSIGVALLEPNVSITEVLARANSALHVAKSRGKNRYCIYQSDSDELLHLQQSAEWFQRIQEGLEEARFEAWYQPLIDLKTGAIAHYEALCRYRDKLGQLHPPSAFLGSAERYNLMPQLDRYMIRRIITELADLSDISVAINLSGASVTDPSIATYIIQCFDESNFDPKRAVFEITETVFMTNLPQARSIVEALQALGCQFALDDFGSGFSSLNYLRHLPVTIVKVDGSFIKELHSDPVNLTLLKSINEIAHLLGKATVAEWIETREAFATLQEIGFDYGQGYYTGRPVSLEVLAWTGNQAAPEFHKEKIVGWDARPRSSRGSVNKS